jgi:hypothetical protein
MVLSKLLKKLDFTQKHGRILNGGEKQGHVTFMNNINLQIH